MAHAERVTDILIVGGGTGGFAAALAIARHGRQCIITEPTDWLGGQLTSQGVPPDENRWIEGAEGVQSATRSYLDFRLAVREWYRDHRKLTAEARANPRLNPGNGWVSHLCHEPAVAREVLHRLLAPAIADGRVRVMYHHEPIAADFDGDRVRSVTVQDTRTRDRTTIRANYFLDATECGDLLPLARIEYAVGAEAAHVHGEMHARADKSDPYDQQAISWCFALEHRPDENHVIDKPADYAFWRDFIPQLTPAWPGRLFSWTVAGDKPAGKTFRFVPWPDEPNKDEWEMWRYRRIVDRSIYAADAPPDVSLINMVQMDYFLRPTLDVSPEDRASAFAAARGQSLSFLYWMQTEAPRHDGGTGYPGLRLRGYELGTADSFAKAPYIREARRILGKTIVTEAHVGREQRTAEKRPATADVPWGTAEPFPDSVGVGHYWLDLHPSTAMRNHLFVDSAPYRIPLGALIPVRMRNLIAAGKCLAVTHITNGCFRLHPVEWTIGEAAGLLATHCLHEQTEPAAVHAERSRLQQYQARLRLDGFALAWPWEEPGAGG